MIISLLKCNASAASLSCLFVSIGPVKLESCSLRLQYPLALHSSSDAIDDATLRHKQKLKSICLEERLFMRWFTVYLPGRKQEAANVICSGKVHKIGVRVHVGN